MTIKLNENLDNVVITVIDNGRGIPQHLLPSVLEPGFSFGKSQGSGLGLSYAVDKIYSWNGNYTIKSEVNEGTIFEIILTKAKPPIWYADQVHVSQNGEIAILDDDEYIHNTWDKTISAEYKKYGINVFHFHIPDELIAYCSNKQNEIKTIYLLDYELAGQDLTGLALIQKLSITNNSILVSNHYEDEDIRKICQQLNIKIMPKTAIKTAKINVIENVEVIFIDDDEVLTGLWKERAELTGKTIAVFNDIHYFMRIFDFYAKSTCIYIDSALGGDLKGEVFARTLYESGYQNIYLATGFEKTKFKNLDWVKDIVDKHPPF